mgnify:CR=1 FL=1
MGFPVIIDVKSFWTALIIWEKKKARAVLPGIKMVIITHLNSTLRFLDECESISTGLEGFFFVLGTLVSSLIKIDSRRDGQP